MRDNRIMSRLSALVLAGLRVTNDSSPSPGLGFEVLRTLIPARALSVADESLLHGTAAEVTPSGASIE